MAEHERNVIVQRTKAGLESARARGRNGGRPKGLLPAYQEIAESVKELYDAEKQLTTQIMCIFQPIRFFVNFGERLLVNKKDISIQNIITLQFLLLSYILNHKNFLKVGYK